MWLYSGFISLGSLAGELEDPVKAYWTALLILVPVVVVLNCMPLIISMTLAASVLDARPAATPRASSYRRPRARPTKAAAACPAVFFRAR